MPSKGRGFRYSLLLVAAGLIALGSVQGSRLTRMREIERFYRWALTAATFSTFGESLEQEKGEGAEPMDDELFADVVALAETALPDIEVGEGDRDAEGQARPKLIRAARQGRDQEIYDVLASPEGVPLAERFAEYAAEDRLLSVGTQFAASQMYQKGSQSQGVGLTSLFFGFRKLAANFLWMQVDAAWHSGQMHRFLPVMHTTVALDPNFVDAYLLGAWHLAYNITAQLSDTPEPQKVFSPKYQRRLGSKEVWYFHAVDFLKDGIRKNPRDFRLYSDLGYAVYETKLLDHANAVKYLKEARRYKHDQWVPRMLCLSLWKNGQYDEALEGWLEYQKQFPASTQAARFIPINTAYLAEAKSDQAAECAKAARAAAALLTAKAADSLSSGDGTTAEKLRVEAEDAEKVAQQMDQMSAEEWEKAKAIYTEILAKDSSDSLANARLSRRAGLEMARQARYHEAVAYLDVARNQYLETESFYEFSDLMIDLKLEGGLPLAVTEQYALERRREAAAYARPDAPKAKRFVECAYALPEKANAVAVPGAAH